MKASNQSGIANIEYQKANQSCFYFQSTSNKEKNRRELTHNKSISGAGQRILLPPAGNTGCYTTAKASSVLHRDNLSELLQKRQVPTKLQHYFSPSFTELFPKSYPEKPSHFCRPLEGRGWGGVSVPGRWSRRQPHGWAAAWPHWRCRSARQCAKGWSRSAKGNSPRHGNLLIQHHQVS